MIRSLYANLLHLHPRPFRQGFSEEMLWIFDQTVEPRARGTLLADAFLSLVRQWALRSEFWQQPNRGALAGPRPDGVPVFYTCANSAPRLGSLLNGVVLTVVSFGALAFVIEHGQTAGFVTLPRVVTPSPNRMPMVARERSAATAESALDLNRSKPAVRRPSISQESVQRVRARNPTLQVPVPNRTGSGARDPSKSSPALKTGRGDHSAADEVAPTRTNSQAARLIALLDKNGDGAISKDERLSEEAERFRKLLARADLNHDGTVTLQELCAVGSIGLDEVLPCKGRG